MGITRFLDGLANLVTGAGTTADRRTNGFYRLPTLPAQQIEAAYRSSFLMRKAVDLIPFDMTRAGRDWQCSEDDTAKIEAEERRLQLWPKLRQALILGRLGGGLLILGVGDANPALPVNARTVTVGSLRYVHVMNRWQVTLGPLIMDPASDLFGQPEYYTLNGQGRQTRIHPSRVVAFKGRLVPGLAGSSADDAFWGDSEVASLMDPVRNADAAMNGFASLIDEAKVDTVSIPGLIQLVATAEGEALLMKRITVANAMKSMHNTRILDGGKGKDTPGEEWDTRQVSWAGMPEMIRTYLAITATAADVPATRFTGKSPDGMNATGDGDERNHQTMIAARQESDLRPALDKVDALLLPSAGVVPSAEHWYTFAPLSQMSEAEAANVFKTKMEAITALQATGTIPDVAFTKAVQNTATEENWLPGLDGALAELSEDERFGLGEEAEDDAADEEADPSALQAEPRRIAANDSKGGGRKAGRPFKGKHGGAHAGHYNEADHPRGSAGRWIGKGGSTQEHVSRALGSGKEHSTTSLGKVSEANAAKVQADTGIDISGHERVLHSGDIRHVFNSHGDPAREAARGQVAIKKDDFDRIPDIVENAYSVRADGARSSRKGLRLTYTATLGGHTYEYAEMVQSDQVVALKTMRKR